MGFSDAKLVPQQAFLKPFIRLHMESAASPRGWWDS